jgi:PKHD-type hydroxylase
VTEENIVSLETLQLKQIKTLDRVFFLKIFTPEQCTKIIDTALNTWIEKESMLQQTVGIKKEQNFVENFDYRNTTLFSPPKPDDWLVSTILGNIKHFNDSEKGYQFDISGMVESPNMMKYSAQNVNPNGKPGKYDWHMDIGVGLAPSMRKLSYSILLNPGEYEGGELVFHIGRDVKPHPGQNSSDFAGGAIVFPSYLVHRVLEVTKGVRYALVGWLHGNSFT